MCFAVAARDVILLAITGGSKWIGIAVLARALRAILASLPSDPYREFAS